MSDKEVSKGNSCKRAFHKFWRNRDELRLEGCERERQEDEIETRVFQGHGYAWVGPEPA